MLISGFLRDLRQGASTLLYPTLCLNCQRAIRPGSKPPLCTPCYLNLSFTEHWKYPENELTDRLAGRFPVAFGAALLEFSDGNAVQSLIHALKYHNRPEIGYELGLLFGEQLAEYPIVQEMDAFVPVPIHRKRRRKRGYNQAEHIANGLGEALGKPVLKDGLARRSFKQSQTRLTKFERIANVEETFTIGRQNLAGKFVVLVDDVVTTGATIDYCAQAIIEAYPGCKIGVAALAMTRKW